MEWTGFRNIAQQSFTLQFMAKSLTFIPVIDFQQDKPLWKVVPLLARQNRKDRRNAKSLLSDKRVDEA